MECCFKLFNMFIELRGNTWNYGLECNGLSLCGWSNLMLFQSTGISYHNFSSLMACHCVDSPMECWFKLFIMFIELREIFGTTKITLILTKINTFSFRTTCLLNCEELGTMEWNDLSLCGWSNVMLFQSTRISCHNLSSLMACHMTILDFLTKIQVA